mgnify:CR=1 FL=1
MTKKKSAVSALAGAPFAPPNWPAMPTLWKITDVIPYEHNSRTHPPAQVTLLAALLNRFGPDQPIVVDENRIILKGHGRRLGSIEGKIEYFPVVQRFGLSEDEKKAMRIADNQVALLAGWDDQLVSFEVKVLERNGFDMKLLGFGDKQLVSFTTALKPPGSFQVYDETIPVDHKCPKCGYVGSGNWDAPKPEPAAAKPPGKTKPTAKAPKKPGK